MLSRQDSADCAHLRSHAGPNAGAAFGYAPTAREFEIRPTYFRTLVLERLRLPLPLVEATCEGCDAVLDPRGLHRAACPVSGRLRARATPTEWALARVCREAGARVRFNVFLRDMNINVAAHDGRRIEVLAQGLPCFGGAQLAIDITVRSATTADGRARPRAALEDGAALEQAREDKERTYPELALSRRCQLVVVALETGGCWSQESVAFLQQLARARAQDAPGYLRRSAELAWARRWTRLLSVAAASSFAASLIEPPRQMGMLEVAGGEAPSTMELLDGDLRCA